MSGLDDIQQAAEVTGDCPDCGRPITDSHLAFTEQWEPGRPEVCYPHVNFGGEQLCAERTVERLRSRISELEAALERSERENEAWRALVWWTHRGTDRGLDACDDDVLVVAADRVVFIGKTALECVESIPGAKKQLGQWKTNG